MKNVTLRYRLVVNSGYLWDEKRNKYKWSLKRHLFVATVESAVLGGQYMDTHSGASTVVWG